MIMCRAHHVQAHHQRDRKYGIYYPPYPNTNTKENESRPTESRQGWVTRNRLGDWESTLVH
jgi:hypothetical protein